MVLWSAQSTLVIKELIWSDFDNLGCETVLFVASYQSLQRNLQTPFSTSSEDGRGMFLVSDSVRSDVRM
jgi:hypothetical protein